MDGAEEGPRGFGRYVLARPLARGDAGVVYLAIALPEMKRCIVKTIDPALSTAYSELAARFQENAAVLLRLDHANLARVLDAGQVEEELYLAVEHVHGRDLGDVLDRVYLRRERLPPAFALYIADGVLAGLEYLHGQGLLHRDLSPTNVMIGFDGAVKLIDLGWIDGEALSDPLRRRLILASYVYMSPEQARLEPLDARADLYSAGAMLFEVFTGKRLADETLDLAALHRRALEPSFVAPSRLEPSLSSEVDALLMQAVEREPERRPRSAGEMRAAIARMQTGGENIRESFAEYLRGLYSDAERAI